MSLESNKSTAMSFLGHMLRGELDDLIGMLASDCRFWVSGDLVNSGLWEGKEAVGAQLRTTGGGHSTLFKGLVRLDIGEVTAEADRVAIEAASFAELTEGGTYENAFHFFFRIRDNTV